MSDESKDKRSDSQFGAKFNLQETSDASQIAQQYRRQDKIDQEKIMRYLQQTPKFKAMYGEARKVMNDPRKKYTAEYLLNQAPELRQEFEKAQFNESHLKLIDKLVAAETRNNKLLKKHGPTTSALLRGKLGVDTFFIAFGFLGLVFLPVYFYYKGSGNREKMSIMMKKFEETKVKDDMDLDDLSVDLKHPKSAEAREKILDQIKREETVKRLAKSDRKSLKTSV